MNCREIMQILEEQSPVSYACEWDNVGLLAGNSDKEIKRIYIALDATDEAVDAAIAADADMLLTHHPLIFKGMKRITSEDFIGRRLIKLLQHDMVYYAMHTNFDVKGMAESAAAMIGLKNPEVLDVTVLSEDKEEGIGRVGSLMEPMTLEQCAKLVEAAFSLNHVKVFGNRDQMVRRAAISPGSGKSEIGNALAKGAEVLITGDIDHHDGIDAVAQGLAIIDAGHYGIEHIFIKYMEKYLEKRCGGIDIIAQEITFPFWIV